jgi:hypothetical protein
MEKEIIRKVSLAGISDIMFDRYPGDNKTELPPERKFYFMRDGKTLMLPAANIVSFLSAQNTDSAAKRFMGKKWKQTCQAFLSFVSVSPFEIPFTRKNKPIVFKEFSNDGDIYIDDRVARLAKGVPNPKKRPVVRLPWELNFEVTVFPNDEFNEDLLYSMFTKGGIAIGLGTFRGVYGKFKVEE